MARTLSGATIQGQSWLGSDGNEGVLLIPQSSSITEASPSDYLVSYHQDTRWRGGLFHQQRSSWCILQLKPTRQFTTTVAHRTKLNETVYKDSKWRRRMIWLHLQISLDAEHREVPGRNFLWVLNQGTQERSQFLRFIEKWWVRCIANILKQVVALNYVEGMQSSFRQLGCKMNIKVHYLHSHLDCFLENLWDLGEDQNEQLRPWCGSGWTNETLVMIRMNNDNKIKEQWEKYSGGIRILTWWQVIIYSKGLSWGSSLQEVFEAMLLWDELCISYNILCFFMWFFDVIWS